MNIICPYRDCQQRIGVTPEDAGIQAACPACDRPMRVPELSAFPPEEVAAMEITGLGALETPSRLDGPSVLDPPDLSRPTEPAPRRDASPGCPKCRKTLGAKARQVVCQLIELSRTGAVVNGLAIDCNLCHSEVRFHDLIWLDEDQPEESGDGANGDSTTRTSFKPPQTRREIARELSDAGVTAASRGDLDLARSKWVKAAEADKGWSVPFFNLAMLALDIADPHQAADFIDLAEIRARKGTSSGDQKVLKQIPALRTRVEKFGSKGLLSKGC